MKLKPIDIILIVLISVVLVSALVNTIRNFSNKGSYCGDCAKCNHQHITNKKCKDKKT